MCLDLKNETKKFNKTRQTYRYSILKIELTVSRLLITKKLSLPMIIGMALRTGRTNINKKICLEFEIHVYILEDETIETTMDVDVDELCTITVANNPSIRLAIGFERTASSVNALPAILPN